MKIEKVVVFGGIIITLWVALFNQGIIALDDYTEGIARFIPAQSNSFIANIDTSGIRFPFQSLFFLSLSKMALGVGLTEPISQLKFVLVIVGILVFSIQLLSAYFMLRTTPYLRWGLFLLSFYFVLPLIYTRPLIENLSGAFVTLSALFATLFYKRGKTPWLFCSVMAISAASLFRLQTSICVLALIPLLVLSQRKKQSWLVFGFSLALGFFLTGILDWALTGGFQKSRLTYLQYNLQHSSSYGTTPFYSFALLFLGLTFPPALVGRYKGFQWKDRYRPLLPVLYFFLTFLIAHSLVPHKEERFVIPILPLFLILLTPLLHYWSFERKVYWRGFYFSGLNFVLLFLTSLSAPQSNVISLVRYLDKDTSLKRIVNYDNSVVLFPTAFSLRPLELIPMKPFLASAEISLSCDTALAVREDLLKADWSSFKVIQEFRPGFLEALLVRLNPKQNARRGAIYLIKDKSCD